MGLQSRTAANPGHPLIGTVDVESLFYAIEIGTVLTSLDKRSLCQCPVSLTCKLITN